MGEARRKPTEQTQEHTRILRVMLAVEDCVAYWKAPAAEGELTQRTRAAFEGRWFGSKSEARVRTLMGDMALRFDSYPGALAALRAWSPPREVAPWICHFHTQLADPIYRRFSGGFLPERWVKGYRQVDRDAVARWVQECWPDRWSPATCAKFGSNLLATAFEAGLLKDRKDPRKLAVPRAPAVAVEYLLYLLREVAIDGQLLDSPYLRAVAPDDEEQRDVLRALTSVRLEALGDVRNLNWGYPDLLSWARAIKGSGLRPSFDITRGAAS